jgi:hypothetical protein
LRLRLHQNNVTPSGSGAAALFFYVTFQKLVT